MRYMDTYFNQMNLELYIKDIVFLADKNVLVSNRQIQKAIQDERLIGYLQSLYPDLFTNFENIPSNIIFETIFHERLNAIDQSLSNDFSNGLSLIIFLGVDVISRWALYESVFISLLP